MDEMRTHPGRLTAEKRIGSDGRRGIDEALGARVTQLERANRELAEFAFTASHDLQAPLRKLDAFTERLRTRLEGLPDAEAHDCMERISRAARSMRELTCALLELARATAVPRSSPRSPKRRLPRAQPPNGGSPPRSSSRRHFAWPAYGAAATDCDSE